MVENLPDISLRNGYPPRFKKQIPLFARTAQNLNSPALSGIFFSFKARLCIGKVYYCFFKTGLCRHDNRVFYIEKLSFTRKLPLIPLKKPQISAAFFGSFSA